MEPTRTPSQVLDQLIASTNAHDLDGLVDCFAEDYRLTDPLHPARSFNGSAQVGKNWATFFTAIPDIHVEVAQRVATDDGFWLEASQVGTRRDGFQLDGRMVFIAAVTAGRISSAHLYLGQVEPGGPDINDVVAAMAAGAGPTPLVTSTDQTVH